jgi:hypothetical protein
MYDIIWCNPPSIPPASSWLVRNTTLGNGIIGVPIGTNQCPLYPSQAGATITAATYPMRISICDYLGDPILADRRKSEYIQFVWMCNGGPFRTDQLVMVSDAIRVTWSYF